MVELKFIEKGNVSKRLDLLLLPTTMSKSEMRQMYGGATKRLNFMRNIILTLVFIFGSNLSYCQQKDYVQQVIEENFDKIEIPVLSQSEMYADFDTLRYLLQNVYPYYYIKSQLCETNYDEKLMNLRSQIAMIQQPDEFIWLLQKVINLFCDGHLAIPNQHVLNFYHRNETLYGIKLTPENIVCTYKYYLLTHDSLQSKIKFGMRFRYMNGNYYTLRAFKYKNQIYPEGMLLKSINGMSIDTFVAYFYSSMQNVSYDYKNKKYFSEYFFVSPYFLNERAHLFVFEDDKTNILKDTFFVDVTVEITKKQEQQKNNPTVFTIYDSILYVRMPRMFGEDSSYIPDIQKFYDAEKIQKIVIDVRENPGGSDMFWKNILSFIISDTIRRNCVLYAQNTKEIRDYMYRKGSDSIHIEDVPLLRTELIKVYEGQDIVFPHEKSIRFNGKIVILQDENTFSAAENFLTIAKENDKIISIGHRMKNIGGIGLTPLLFQLPYTNMLIRMPLNIDYSKVNHLSDFLRNVPQIECERSISAFLQSYYLTNPYQLESLLQDECFLKAISL